MNIYRYVFTGPCPNNQRAIDYWLEIRAQRVIMVEEIAAECDRAKEAEKPYHETIADRLFEKFGGQQRMVAFHHGVWIETLRG